MNSLLKAAPSPQFPKRAGKCFEARNKKVVGHSWTAIPASVARLVSSDGVMDFHRHRVHV